MAKVEVTDRMLGMMGSTIRIQIYEIEKDAFRTVTKDEAKRVLEYITNPPAEVKYQVSMVFGCVVPSFDGKARIRNGEILLPNGDKRRWGDGLQTDFDEWCKAQLKPWQERPEMSMREKVARAFHERTQKWMPLAEYDRCARGWRDEMLAAADAALDALLEPTAGMHEALSATDILWKNQTSQGVWQTYIRAAKEGK